MSRPVNADNLELNKPHHQRHGLRRACLDFEKLNYKATGTYIKLTHATLCKLADGGKTSSEAHADQAWLTAAKTDVIINFELWERVQKEWEAIPAYVCQNLISSMPRRVHAVLQAKGGYTKY